MNQITFASGVTITKPATRLEQFLDYEYDWYDGIEDAHPDEIRPEDILAAVGINAFVGRSGVASLRTVQIGLAKHCTSLLRRISPEPELSELDDLSGLIELIAAGTETRGALTAVATKVLHRKRRRLIPILDSVMVTGYCSAREAMVLQQSYVSRDRLDAALRSVLSAVQRDVKAAAEELSELARHCSKRGWPVSPLRVHDILVWTESEARGYYR